MNGKRTLVLAVVAVACSAPAMGAKTLIGVDTQWTADHGPYVFDDNVLIAGGATLTIDPDADEELSRGVLEVLAQCAHGEPGRAALATGQRPLGVADCEVEVTIWRRELTPPNGPKGFGSSPGGVQHGSITTQIPHENPGREIEYSLPSTLG